MPDPNQVPLNSGSLPHSPPLTGEMADLLPPSLNVSVQAPERVLVASQPFLYGGVTASPVFDRFGLSELLRSISASPDGRANGPMQMIGEIDGVRHFGLPGMLENRTLPERPLRVAILTSLRDIVGDEHVGELVTIGDRRVYMGGTLECALQAVNDDRLGGIADIVAVITDDMPKDLVGLEVGPTPKDGSRWIHNQFLRNAAGELATNLVCNLPSTFRGLPRDDHAGRAAHKFAFESAIANVMAESGADVLISDHYLGRIEYLIRPDSFGLYGRVLNTHPGITRADHPYRCIGVLPYLDAILHARGKHADPKSRAERGVEPYFMAGASFHVIDADFDTGPLLCEAELTPVHPDDTILAVNHRMYETSKNLVFVAGLRHYARNFWPLFARGPESGEIVA